MLEYYERYEKLFGAVGSKPTSPYSVEELLTKLEQNTEDSKKKNVEVLQLAAEVSHFSPVVWTPDSAGHI